MQAPRPRKPRFRRTPEGEPLRLTERDFSLLALVSEHRFLQSHHLATLLPGSEQHVVRRLGRLFHAGYLHRPQSQRLLVALPRETIAYTLTERGRRALQTRGIPVFSTVPRLRSKDSAFSLTHDLHVSEAVVALRAGAAAEGLQFRWHHQRTGQGNLSVLRWNCRLSYGDASKSCLVIPDASFTLGDAEDARSWFFLELDRGTMPAARRHPHQTSFLRKVLAYKETRRAGLLWKWEGIPGFRVLVVTESEARLRSLRRVTAESFQRGESKLFLFATLDELRRRPSPSAPTWRTCAGEAAVLWTQ